MLDASGRHAFIARRKRLLERVEEHPIAAVWGRWNGVGDLDGVAVVGADPRNPRLKPIAATRRLATNHFCGYGWWCWKIPLACGKTSLGLVYDKRLFEPPGDGTIQQRYESFVRSQDGLSELLRDAELDSDDTMAYSHLPYSATRFADRGWALLGDAGMFMDPFYSPGLDNASISVLATVELIEAELAGELDGRLLEERLAEHNANLVRSQRRWIEALYVGKYKIFGDAELATAAFLVETASYYLFVVSPAYRDLKALTHPIFGLGTPQVAVAHKVSRAFNRRLQKLAERRLRSGLYGRRNVGWHLGITPFVAGWKGVFPLLQGLGIWLRAETSQFVSPLLRRRGTPLGERARGESG